MAGQLPQIKIGQGKFTSKWEVAQRGKTHTTNQISEAIHFTHAY